MKEVKHLKKLSTACSNEYASLSLIFLKKDENQEVAWFYIEIKKQLENCSDVCTEKFKENDEINNTSSWTTCFIYRLK